MKKPPKRKPGRGVACPACGAPTITLYSRPQGRVTFRRRQCSKCGERLTTKEIPVNRGAGGSEDRTATAISIAQLLQSVGLTPADLPRPGTVEPGSPDERPATDPR